MTRPALDAGRVSAYLDRLGSPELRHDAEGLARLQSAHLMAVPFHNLLLLANDGQPWSLPPLPQVVDGAIAGLGGNCDRTTPPFAALLSAIGFDAHLAAATVRERGDHFVCIVHIDGRRHLCDVGNGHPYLRPWDLDGPAQEQAFVGWRFRFEPAAPEGPTLLRVFPDGSQRPVYVVDPTPQAYDAFRPMVIEHYTRPGFGPFLTGLRATRIQPDAMLTLRDQEYARDTRFGRSVRRLAGREGVQALLTERIGLPAGLVRAALEVLHRRHPELLEEPRWWALGRGRCQDSAGEPPPPRDAVPDVLVSVATVGRPASVRRLLDTLRDELRASGYPGRVGVLLVENHAPAEPAPGIEPQPFPIHTVPIDALRPALDRAAAAGVLPPPGERPPAPIGAAREAQIAALHAHLHTPNDALPHPSRHPVVVWMVDDDVAFQQLGPHGQIARHTNLLYRAARMWSALPQHAVVLGTFTGDPPIPGLDTLGGQLHDLAESLALMLRLGPDAGWTPPPPPPPTFDAYYDLTEARAPDAQGVWPYAPRRAGARVREVALELLRDLPRLVDGQQLTRPLVWDGHEADPRPSLRRGGNTLFLDLDALFRWPTPALAAADGVTTRRADTVWAALAQADDPCAVVEATLPLLHGREDQAASAGHPTSEGAAHRAAAQVRGVALARAVAEGRPVEEELPAREARVRAHRRLLRVRLANLRVAVHRLTAWGEPELDLAVVQADAVLDTLDGMAAAGDPTPGDPAELRAFLAGLPDAVRAWRGGW